MLLERAFHDDFCKMIYVSASRENRGPRRRCSHSPRPPPDRRASIHPPISGSRSLWPIIDLHTRRPLADGLPRWVGGHTVQREAAPALHHGSAAELRPLFGLDALRER